MNSSRGGSRARARSASEAAAYRREYGNGNDVERFAREARRVRRSRGVLARVLRAWRAWRAKNAAFNAAEDF